MGERGRGAVAAAAVVVTVAAAVLVLTSLLTGTGTPLSPGRAEASCARSLVYEGVYWFQQNATEPIELGDAVEGAALAPCNDTSGANDREDPVDAYRVPALGPDYLAISAESTDLFKRSTTPYVTTFSADNVLDVIALVLVLVVVLGAVAALIARLVRKRRVRA
jgi:hypothetical protein